MKLSKEKQSYVLDSICYLRSVVDLDGNPEIDIIDKYDETASESAKPFPITYHIDYDKQHVYLINIEISFRQLLDFYLLISSITLLENFCKPDSAAP